MHNRGWPGSFDVVTVRAGIIGSVSRDASSGACPQNFGDPGNALGKIVMMAERVVCAGARLSDEMGCAFEQPEEAGQPLYVAGINLPAATEPFDVQSRGGFSWPYEEDRAASGHERIRFAGDDAAERRGVLCDEADITGAEMFGKMGDVPVGLEGDVGDTACAAKLLKRVAARPGPGEGEVELRAAGESQHRSRDGFGVVRQAEIAGVEDLQTTIAMRRQRPDSGTVGPVFGDMNSFRRNATFQEAATHARTKSNDRIGSAPGVVGSGADDTVEERARANRPERGGNVRVEIHFPDDVPCSTEPEQCAY